MIPRRSDNLITGAVALAGVLALTWWIAGTLRSPRLPERDLGIDMFARAPVAMAPAGTSAGGFYHPEIAVPALPGSWPGFRGPNHDNVAIDPAPLARTWPAAGPRAIWSVQLGDGYAAPAIHQGRVYVIDYDKAAQSDALRCFSLETGAEIWRRTYPVVVKPNHGMSRTVPAVTDQYVVSLGPKCHVLCCDARTGEVRWQHDLVAEYGAVVPEWYAGQCPIIEKDRVILAPGGKAMLVALDLATGKTIWEAPNPRRWNMTHASILPVETAGRRTLVWCGSGGVAGVSAEDGKVLWETADWTIETATVPTPVAAGPGRIFLSGGYEAGAMMLEIVSEGAVLKPRVVWKVPPSVFGSDQQTPIFYRGFLYGVIPNGQMVCLDPANGKHRWASGSTHRFGLGAYAIGGGLLFAVADSGLLSLIDPSPDAFKLLGQARVLEGPEAWGPIAFAGTRVLLRDLGRMVCLDAGGP